MSSKNKNKLNKQFQKNRLMPLGPDPFKYGGISKRGWKVIGLGVAIAAIGYYVLSLTDPAGQNWASNLSPFLLLGGYATLAIGIILPEKESIPESTSTPNPTQPK